jgi:hypothetical protein
VELNAWIASLSEKDAIDAAAERLEEKPRTVYSWVRFDRAPSFKSAMNIVKKADGAVDFNGIYYPFMREVDEGRGRF